MRLTGIIPPLLTQFTEEGAVDHDRIRMLVSFLKPYVQGFFVCGTYGSGPLMRVEERMQVLETVAADLDETHQLVVHVGAASQRDCLSLAEHAARNGAQAVSAVPPYYFRYDDEALFEYYRLLIEASPLPVYVYDNPGTTGNPVSPELVDRLAQIGLNGVKDSSFDINKTYAFIRKVGKPGFDVAIGSESLLLPAFAMGVQACISGLANVLPELMQQLYEAARAADMRAASQLQAQVLKMWDILHYGPSIPTAFAMLRVRGFDAGFPRRPMLPLRKDIYGKVERAMQETRALWDLRGRP